MGVRLEWDGKPTQVERLSLPFQTVETINESRATRERDTGALFGGAGPTSGSRNQLIWGDNKLVMSSLLSEYAGMIKLVYIDPPFDTGADFAMRVDVGGADVTKQPSILEEHAYRDTWGAGYASYLSMMYPRLILIHELLSDDGSLYLHCEPTVSHTLRLLCDEIFGQENFRNEIAWKRTSAHSSARRYGPVHDTILFYSKTASFVWNPQPRRLEPEDVSGHDVMRDADGRPYRLSDPTGAGVRRGETGQVWRGIDVTAKGRHWAYPPSVLDQLEGDGRLVLNTRGVPRLKRYLDELAGIQAQDVWTDIGPV